MTETEEFNAMIGGCARFQETFQIGPFQIQPHILHLSEECRDRKTSAHAHQSYELSFLLKGKAKYWVQGEEASVREGEGIAIPPKTVHSKRMDSDSVILGFMLFIFAQGDGSRLHLAKLREGVKEKRGRLPGNQNIARALAQLAKLPASREPYLDERVLCLCREIYLEFISLFAPSLPSSPASPRAEKFQRGESGNILVDAAKFFIEDNAHRPLAPSEVSRHLGVSLVQLNKIFRANDGRSVGRRIADTKLYYARQLLENSARSVKDIASSLGFEDANYFCRFFRKRLGVSPTEFRRSGRGAPTPGHCDENSSRQTPP